MTIDPYSALAGRKAELLHWLTEEGRFAPDTGRLLELLCDKLAALGIPIARATAHVRTLHPEYRGASRIWRRGESIEIRTTRHGIEFTSDYQNSPIQHVIETGQWLDTMLSEATDRRFPILATLRAQGITHYVMAPLVFSNRIVNAMSWATDAPGGFAEADVELFRDLVTAFSPFSKRRRGGGFMVNFLPPMSVAIRVRRSWRAPSNGAKSIISKQQCCSPIYAVSADSPMSFRRSRSLSSSMPSSTWWYLVS
jgi:hypothetical protein